MVDLTFTPQILSAEYGPRRRHWSDADKIRVVEKSSGASPGLSNSAAEWYLPLAADSLAATVSELRACERKRPCFIASKDGAGHCCPVAAAAGRRRTTRDPSANLRNGRRLLGPSSVEPEALARLLLILDGT